MKTIIVQGQPISGKNYGDLRRKIIALNLKTDETTNAIIAAKEVFSKREGRRGYPGQQAKGTNGVSRQEMQLQGVTLEVFKGPMRSVLQLVQGRPRNVVLAMVETFFTSKQAVIVAIKGSFDTIAYGKIDKDALMPYFKQDGYSLLSSMKAVGDRRNGVVIQATGQNLHQPNVREFAQAFAKIAYEGSALRGTQLNGKDVSTNVFLTPDTMQREAATWPVDNPGAYAVVDIGSLPISYLGQHGYVGITSAGKIMVALFGALIAAGWSRAFNAAAKVAEMPWKELATSIDLQKIGGKIIDVAISHSTVDTFKVFVTGEGKIAVLTLAFKNGEFALTGQIEYLAFNYQDMALIGRANDTTAMLGNRNGGRTALEFMPVHELDKGLVSAFALPAMPERPQAQA